MSWPGYEEIPADALEEWRAWEIEREMELERASRAAAFITVADAARRMGLNHKTIRERIRRGEIPRYGPERAVRVRWADVVAAFTHRPRHHRDGSRMQDGELARETSRPPDRRGGRFSELARTV